PCHIHNLALYSFPTRRSSDLFRSDKYRSIGKVRDREDALASTRDAYATPRNPPLIPFCPPCREYAKIFRRLAHPGGGCSGCTLADRKSTRLNSSHQIISYAVF